MGDILFDEFVHIYVNQPLDDPVFAPLDPFPLSDLDVVKLPERATADHQPDEQKHEIKHDAEHGIPHSDEDAEETEVRSAEADSEEEHSEDCCGLPQHVCEIKQHEPNQVRTWPYVIIGGLLLSGMLAYKRHV